MDLGFCGVFGIVADDDMRLLSIKLSTSYSFANRYSLYMATARVIGVCCDWLAVLFDVDKFTITTATKAFVCRCIRY